MKKMRADEDAAAVDERKNLLQGGVR